MSEDLDFVENLIRDLQRRDLQRRNTTGTALLRKPDRHQDLGRVVMTNFDHSIDQDVVKELQRGPYFAQYSGWNFCGYVWRSAKKKVWNCEVWRYNSHIDTVSAKTLEDVMETVCATYGSE